MPFLAERCAIESKRAIPGAEYEGEEPTSTKKRKSADATANLLQSMEGGGVVVSRRSQRSEVVWCDRNFGRCALRQDIWPVHRPLSSKLLFDALVP